MDARLFLKERTRFIRYFYDNSVAPFAEIKAAIEEERPPFDAPPYDESGEPAFLSEWEDAHAAIDLAGLTCVSLLTDSLKLYLETLKSHVIGFKFSGTQKQLRGMWKPGWITVYRRVLGEILGTDWSGCPVDFGVLEQVVLARNRAQHGTDLTSLRVTHDTKTLGKFPRPFFANSAEIDAHEPRDGSWAYIFNPAVEVRRDTLFAAIGEAEALADWIDAQEDRVWAWRTSKKSAPEADA
ncbi:hypothetical protein [Caulobacter sp.]|uniref:hypothetical protein n=1 Tax=Caulobacter sp. TaxID=78 RepID=UPI003BABE3F6